MVKGSNGRFVIRHRPPTKSKGSWYFSTQQSLFVDLKDATVFRSKEIAVAFANEFDIKLNQDTDIIDIREINDSTFK